VTFSPSTRYAERIEVSPGDEAMSGYPGSDFLLEIAKLKIRELHRERAAIQLAREARNARPGRIRTAVNQVIQLFKLWVLSMGKWIGLGVSD
jgi:hypothetical protein